MTSENFKDKAIKMVSDYAVDHMDKADKTTVFDVFVVWECYILGHQKALLSTTLYDGMYYEVTYNSNKNEFYFDVYKKFENRCIKEEN